MSIENNHKQFKQWWSKAKNTLKCDEYDAFEIWQASANREGYKLAPVEPNQKQIDAGVYAVDLVSNDSIQVVNVYKAMIGACDDH